VIVRGLFQLANAKGKVTATQSAEVGAPGTGPGIGQIVRTKRNR